MKKNVKNKGVATLPTILALTILILSVGIAITAMGLTESIISAGQKQSSGALLFAEAGARDALVRIARDKNFISASYQVDFVSGGCVSNEGCATISVSSGTGTSADPKIIDSQGRVKSNIRKVRVKVIFDASLNGEMQNIIWEEITD
jgi:Tfp pilus assembly protein PilX